MHLCCVFIGFDSWAGVVVVCTVFAFAVCGKGVFALADCPLLIHFNNKYITRYTIVKYKSVSDWLQGDLSKGLIYHCELIGYFEGNASIGDDDHDSL